MLVRSFVDTFLDSFFHKDLIKNLAHFSFLTLSAQKFNKLGPNSQHFIFFLTFEWAQSAIMLHYASLKKAFQL